MAANLAMLDGVPFRVNPQAISWDYTMKYKMQETMGGRVIQLFGVKLGDLTIEGVFGAGGPKAQEEFFNRITTIMKSQSPRDPKANPRPVRFLWPDRRWDFTCYVRSITQPGVSDSVAARNDIINPGYRLVLFIQEDNQDIIQAVRDAASAAYINRLTAGMGWKQTSWNGPTGTAELQDSLHGQTVLEAIINGATDRANLASNQVGITPSPDTTFNAGAPDAAAPGDQGD